MADTRTGQRFAISLPARIGAGTRERAVKTKNVSAAGVLIEADPSLRVGARVQFCITLPRKLLGLRKDVDVKCDGRVVRVEKKKNGKTKVRDQSDGRVGVACIIDNYVFVRRK
jgi:hypothetical protein